MVYNTYIRTYYDIHTYVRTRVYIRTYVRTMVYIHTYVHACIHTYNGIHTCVLWYTYTVLKITIRSCQSFIQIWHFIVDYQWFPHWKCTVKFVPPNWIWSIIYQNGSENDLWQTIILSSAYIHTYYDIHIYTYNGIHTYILWCMYIRTLVMYVVSFSACTSQANVLPRTHY